MKIGGLWRRGPGTFALTVLIALFLQLMPLPVSLSLMRPLWLPLALAYWALFGPNVAVLSAAVLAGLALDTATDCPLGQHVLGFLLIAWLLTRLRSTLGLYPQWQLAVSLIPVWLMFALLMWTLDGMAHHRSEALPRFLPVISTAVLWPMVAMLLDAVRGKAAVR